jgi:hypothetical protein
METLLPRIAIYQSEKLGLQARHLASGFSIHSSMVDIKISLSGSCGSSRRSLLLNRSSSTPNRNSNLKIPRLNILRQLVKLRALRHALPSRQARIKDLIHFLERLSSGLGGSEEHVDECEAVECREYHVHLPIDVPEERWHGEGKDTVPEPVRCCGEGDGFGSDFGGEDFGSFAG